MNRRDPDTGELVVYHAHWGVGVCGCGYGGMAAATVARVSSHL